MGQKEIYEFLLKKGEPVSTGEIAKEMDEHFVKVSMRLRQMIKFNEVQFVEIDRLEAMKRCGSKRRLRLYYVEKRNKIS